jgi:hypothetical protein
MILDINLTFSTKKPHFAFSQIGYHICEAVKANSIHP